jgi:hypothetical protein
MNIFMYLLNNIPEITSAITAIGAIILGIINASAVKTNTALIKANDMRLNTHAQEITKLMKSTSVKSSQNLT